ncbi:uroporphyrinogen-III synthase [Kiloniella antarctica]|uniref:Uroporphyrinogen-III synthase n=1 Tax=Kiloniella antarctica TaxID=1550907 RepID=A0ABW5BJH7_9PROT
MIKHLVTRPVVDHEPFVSELKTMGRDVILFPVFDILFYPEDKLDLSNVQAILITSANGVRALCQNSNDFSFPVYCVGNSSAEAARDAGFEKVYSANGDVADLAELVCENLPLGGGVLVHPAASKLAGDLGKILTAKGFCYQRKILYEAKAITQLNFVVTNLIKSNNIKEISFFSPRSSRTFSKLLKQEKLEDKLQGCRAYCLSPAVSKYLEDIKGMEVVAAEHPTRQSLLRLMAADK